MTTQAHSRKQPEHIQSSAAQTVPGSLLLPEHQCPSTSAPACPLSHIRPQPGSSVHWGQEKTTFQCKERASAKLLPPTTLATAKHSKTKQINTQDKLQSCKQRKGTTKEPNFRGSSTAASPQKKGSPSTSHGRWQHDAVVLIRLYPNLLLMAPSRSEQA